MQRPDLYPFPSRPGAATSSIELDLDNPDASNHLNPEQLDAVYAFEQDLYDATLPAEQYAIAADYGTAPGTKVEGLEKTWDKKINTTSIGINYLMTEDGRAAFAEATGTVIESDDKSEVRKLVAGQDISNVSSKVLSKLEADSIGFEEALLARTFIEAKFKGATVPDPETITLYKNPAVLLEKVQGYRAYKEYLRKATHDIVADEAEDPAVTHAKLTLVSIYRQKVNRLLVGDYVHAYKYLHQQKTATYDADQKPTLLVELEAALPAFSTEADAKLVAGFLQRVDRYRQGVSRQEDGTFTWLSQQAESLAASANTETAHELIDRDVYSDIDPDQLTSVEIDGVMFGEMVSDVLKEYGLLSEETEWDGERTGPASDSKWQVIINDKFKSLAVDDKQRIVKVPVGNKILLTAIALINHEFTHVLQGENKRAIGRLAIMKRMGMDVAMEQAESGGKWQERVAREAMSGKPDNEVAGTGYLAALKTKQAGGTYGNAVEAFYTDLVARNPKMKPAMAALQAVNRAKRIYRNGGFDYASTGPFMTNTQPLNYLEQNLIYESLSGEQRKLLFVGGVSIRNLVELSDAGLVDTTKIVVPPKMPWQILRDKAAQIISAQAE